MNDYIDFIDSPTVRDHLRMRPPLSPAQQCILIAQSECRSLKDKLAALRKIRSDTPPDGFADGEYQLACNDLGFADGLDRHIQRKEERLAAFLAPAPDVVYVPHDPRNGYDLASFATFTECLDSLRDIESADERDAITIARCRTGKPDDTLTGFLGPGKVLVDVETEADGHIDYDDDAWRWNFAKAYVRIPHGFRPGDIVQWGDGEYSVVVHPELPKIFEKWRRGLDYTCQFFSTLAFSPDETHPCGGKFFIQDVFPIGVPVVERVTPDKLPDKYGILLAVADVVEDSNCICQLLESYSHGHLDDLIEFAKKNRIGPDAERAVPLSVYETRVDRLAFLLVETWCLCRYFQLYNSGNGNFAHYIAVLKACINHLKCLGIRRLVGEERKRDKWLTLATMLGEDYELGETDHVVRVIKEAFDSERITDESQRMKVAQDFADNIMELIDVIAYDSKDVDEYVRNTFMAGNAMPVLPKCPEKVASARAFVNRLSSQFDEGKLRVLTPELKDRLLDSFNILHDYGKSAPWAKREADFASSLLAFIPRACTVSGERKS